MFPILCSSLADTRGRRQKNGPKKSAKKEGHKRSLGPTVVKVYNLQRGTANARHWEEKDRKCVGCHKYGEGEPLLQEKDVPSFLTMLKILPWLMKGKKRGPQDQLGPFIVLKVITPPEGNSCCGGTGRKKPPKCISCVRYDGFMGIHQSFNVHASHAIGAGLADHPF